MGANAKGKGGKHRKPAPKTRSKPKRNGKALVVARSSPLPPQPRH